MKKTRQTVQVSVSVVMLDDIGDLQPLPSNQVFELELTYPLSIPATYQIKTGKGGMGLGGLLREIGKAYNKVYKSDTSIKKYGVWGHGIGDLFIEGISVNYQTKKITLQVGS